MPETGAGRKIKKKAKKEMKNETKQETMHLKEIEKKFRETFMTLIISAFGFVAALSWNDAIKSSIDLLLPQERTIAVKFLSAFFVTVVVVIATYLISRGMKKG